MMKALLASCLLLSTALYARQKSASPSKPSSEPQARNHAREFENQYLKIQILPHWAVANSADRTLNLVRGKYLLSINPVFQHASGIIGGRFSEIVSAMQSVNAVMAGVDKPAGGFECAQWPSEAMTVTPSLALTTLYTDSSKVNHSKVNHGCTLPSDGRSVWFGSFATGEGSASEFAITLGYRTNDVNRLPKKGAPELRRVFGEVTLMLRSLQLKTPVIASKLAPPSAIPGTTVTIYGSGFDLLSQPVRVVFSAFPNNPMAPAIVAGDGRSLTFQIPTSVDTLSCPPGRINVNESCIPTPPNHVDVNDCPLRSAVSAASPVSGRSYLRSLNFCGIPFPPGTYQVYVSAGGSGLSINSPLPLTVTAPEPDPVSILLLYPNSHVSAGDTITVRGSGFTPSGNTVTIGSAVVANVSSADGKTITFQAPAPAGRSFIPIISRIYDASVSNANGRSNSIAFEYQ